MTDNAENRWHDASGMPVTCQEKRKVLEGNLREIAAYCQDALDDAVLMGCSRQAFKEAVVAMVEQLEPTVKERS